MALTTKDGLDRSFGLGCQFPVPFFVQKQCFLIYIHMNTPLCDMYCQISRAEPVFFAQTNHTIKKMTFQGN